MDSRPIEQLKGWEDNPRDITESDFNRLKKQLELGEFKPLLVMEDGTVLGGNMRLRAYQELGISRVWVATIKAIEDGEVWRAEVNGKQAQKVFDSKEQMMLEYALADNDRVGTYNDLALAELYQRSPLELDLYKIDLNLPTRVEDLALGVGVDVAGREIDTSDMADKQQIYEHGTVKQIVTYFSNEQYLDVMERMQRLMKTLGLTNNTTLFFAALKALEDQQAQQEAAKK